MLEIRHAFLAFRVRYFSIRFSDESYVACKVFPPWSDSWETYASLCWCLHECDGVLPPYTDRAARERWGRSSRSDYCRAGKQKTAGSAWELLWHRLLTDTLKQYIICQKRINEFWFTLETLKRSFQRLNIEQIALRAYDKKSKCTCKEIGVKTRTVSFYLKY